MKPLPFLTLAVGFGIISVMSCPLVEAKDTWHQNYRHLDGKSLQELRLLRNELFARHGRKFRSQDLADYFSKQPWYRINPQYTDTLLSEKDQTLVRRILILEQALRTRQGQNVSRCQADLVKFYNSKWGSYTMQGLTSEEHSCIRNELLSQKESLDSEHRSSFERRFQNSDFPPFSKSTQPAKILHQTELMYRGKNYTLLYTQNGQNWEKFLYLLPESDSIELKEVSQESIWTSWLRDEGAAVPTINKVVLQQLASNKAEQFKTKHEVVWVQLEGPSDDPEWLIFGFDKSGKFRRFFSFTGRQKVLERITEDKYIIVDHIRGDEFTGALFCDDKYLFDIRTGELTVLRDDGCRSCRVFAKECGTKFPLYSTSTASAMKLGTITATVTPDAKFNMDWKQCWPDGTSVWHFGLKDGTSGWADEATISKNLTFHAFD
ncbi:YARHG domain-containing protein [Elusimicrobiota bacterium]